MVACKGYAAGEGRGSNPLAFGIAIARSVSASDRSFSDIWRHNLFSFVKLLFGEVCPVPQKVRNIDTWLGFYFAVANTSNAQGQLHHHVRTENDDIRDGGELGAVATNSPPLSLCPLPRT